MNRLAEARAKLVAALEPVLPGRVDPYGAEALPCMYLGVGVPTLRQSGSATFKAARFAVAIEYDGSDRAQIAGLDEVTSKACDAIDATPGLRWTDAQPLIDRITDDADRVRQVLVLTVEVTIGVGTFCVPDVEAATTPPPIVPRIA